jgi:hypothetical protein
MAGAMAVLWVGMWASSQAALSVGERVVMLVASMADLMVALLVMKKAGQMVDGKVM